jgi:hypothetical protein
MQPSKAFLARLAASIIVVAAGAYAVQGVLAKPSIALSRSEIHLPAPAVKSSDVETVQIENIGNARLVISRVAASCSCTGTSLDKSEVAPGDAASLQIRLGPGAPGRAMIAIYSNDPAAPVRTVELFFYDEHQQSFSLEPDHLDFGRIKRGAAPPTIHSALVVHDLAPHEDAAKSFSLRSTSPDIDATLTSVRKSLLRIVVTLHAEQPGAIEKFVEILRNGRDTGRRVRISAVVQ